MDSLKKYYTIIIMIFIIGIIFYNHLFLKEFKNTYKQNGLYTVGTIKEVRGYGRGTGFNYVYTFNLNGKKYESVCDIGNLSYSKAAKKINNNFLVIYLNNDVYNNRIYSNIPINDTISDNIKLKEFIDSNMKIKSKIDSIPSPGFFFRNYF